MAREIVWKDIGIQKGADRKETASALAEKYAERIARLSGGSGEFDRAAFVKYILRESDASFERTRSAPFSMLDVPWDKQRFDYEAMHRALFLGYTAQLTETESEIAEELRRRAEAGEMRFDKGLSFFHALESIVTFAEQGGLARDKAGAFVSTLCEKSLLDDPLYLREMLNNPQRLIADRASGAEPRFDLDAFAERLREDQAAAEFFANRPGHVELPQKFVVYSVDGQARHKVWRTYEQVALRTAQILASVATYGIVPGGVVGGVRPTQLYGTIDRADLCIINWYPAYQGAVLVPLEDFVQNRSGVQFLHSMSVMVDGDKTTGTDVVVGPDSSGVLPTIDPSKFLTIVPRELEGVVALSIRQLGTLLRRPDEEIYHTLGRCIGYNPSVWQNFHYFNEWLQSTSEGNALLAEKLGREIPRLPSLSEVKQNILA